MMSWTLRGSDEKRVSPSGFRFRRLNRETATVICTGEISYVDEFRWRWFRDLCMDSRQKSVTLENGIT